MVPFQLEAFERGGGYSQDPDAGLGPSNNDASQMAYCLTDRDREQLRLA